MKLSKVRPPAVARVRAPSHKSPATRLAVRQEQVGLWSAMAAKFVKSKAESLFDSAFGRKALTPIVENNIEDSARKRPARKAKEKANESMVSTSKKKKSKTQVFFADEDDHQVNYLENTIPFEEPVKKYTKSAKKKSMRTKKAPVSTADAVYEAYCKSNLPDFDALPELNVIDVNRWEVDNQPARAYDPNVEDLLAVFETSGKSSSNSNQTRSFSADGSTVIYRNRRHCMTPQEIIRHSSSMQLRRSPEPSLLTSPEKPPEDSPVKLPESPPRDILEPLNHIASPISPPEKSTLKIPEPPMCPPRCRTPERSYLSIFDGYLSSICIKNVPQSTPLPSNLPSTIRKRYSSVFASSMRSDCSKLRRTIVPVNIALSPIQKNAPAQPTHANLHTAVGSFAVAFAETSVIYADGREDILTDEDKFLALCSPSYITSFDFVFTPELLKTAKKIGEGSYGEVYKATAADGSEIVLKIIPFEITGLSAEEAFAELLPELVIFNTFNSLNDGSRNRTPNFIRWISSSCVKGKFPAKLVSEWDAYDEKKVSENEDPRKFKEDSLHLVVVTNNGGDDLEKYKFNSAEQALSVFLQVAFTLAAAEAEFQFEHRDLHWGNILISPCKEAQIDYTVNGMSYDVNSCGLIVQIIDFTLSRITKDGYVVFSDLSGQNDLFGGPGRDQGKRGDYQFDIYRLMKEANGNNWQAFTPKTNTLWLDYLIDKLLNFKKYRSRNREHKMALDMLKEFHPFVKAAPSASSLVASSFMNDLLTRLSR